jgi:hypothetical protein
LPSLQSRERNAVRFLRIGNGPPSRVPAAGPQSSSPPRPRPRPRPEPSSSSEPRPRLESSSAPRSRRCELSSSPPWPRAPGAERPRPCSRRVTLVETAARASRPRRADRSARGGVQALSGRAVPVRRAPAGRTPRG